MMTERLSPGRLSTTGREYPQILSAIALKTVANRILMEDRALDPSDWSMKSRCGIVLAIAEAEERDLRLRLYYPEINPEDLIEPDSSLPATPTFPVSACRAAAILVVMGGSIVACSWVTGWNEIIECLSGILFRILNPGA